MSNKYLAREDAPFGSETWEVLDKAMVNAAKNQLTGRRLLNIEGPFGLGLKVVPLQDTAEEEGFIHSPTLPVHMIYEPFTMGARDLAHYEMDNTALDTRPVAAAAIACAQAEEELIFNGGPGVPGLLTVEGANAVELSAWENVGDAADDLISALTTLDEAGFHGPYTLALAPKRYNKLFRRYKSGNQSEIEHVRMMATEGVFKAPALKEGGVILATGRQFASIVLGQDMTIGFIGPAGDKIEFYISESLTVRILQPKSICVLKE
jgi:uncharacterized linocin/CFP29 family protein